VRKYTISTYSVIALAGLAVVSGAVLWQSRDVPVAGATQVNASPVALAEYNPIRSLIVPSDLLLSTTTSAPLLNLRMDNALSTTSTKPAPRKPESLRELASRKANGSPSPAAENEPDLKMPAPLNLRVPELEDNHALNNELANRNEESAHDREPAVASSPSAFDLNDRPAPAAPKVASYSLFNPEYGLRGFMKQGWVSSTLGFQGGLGLNDGRRIQSEDDSLQDDIAVGMGVILAF